MQDGGKSKNTSTTVTATVPSGSFQNRSYIYISNLDTCKWFEPTTMAIILGTLCSNGVPLTSFGKHSCLAPLPPCTMLKLGFETGD